VNSRFAIAVSPASESSQRPEGDSSATSSLAIHGDESLAAMVRPAEERVFRLALRITRNNEDAEDVRQETFLKVHRKWEQFEGRSRFTTWVSRIAINEALMCLRKRRSGLQPHLEEDAPAGEGQVVDDLASPMEDPETAYARYELRDSLVAAVAHLRPANRRVFLLRVLEQRSTIETARALRISASAVKARMRRARTELREALRAVWTPASEQPAGNLAVSN
jgi:RNA polymerase sigma-70 factor, ECF subfamily